MVVDGQPIRALRAVWLRDRVAVLLTYYLLSPDPAAQPYRELKLRRRRVVGKWIRSVQVCCYQHLSTPIKSSMWFELPTPTPELSFFSPDSWPRTCRILPFGLFTGWHKADTDVYPLRWRPRLGSLNLAGCVSVSWSTDWRGVFFILFFK